MSKYLTTLPPSVFLTFVIYIEEKIVFAHIAETNMWCITSAIISLKYFCQMYINIYNCIARLYFLMAI